MSKETKTTAGKKAVFTQPGATESTRASATQPGPARSQGTASNTSTGGVSGSVSNATQAPQPTKLKSKKLDRTLAELETAFAAWDSITDDVKPAPQIEPKKRAESVDSKSQDQEFRTKTKKLLSQLRDQLADLSDD